MTPKIFLMTVVFFLVSVAVWLTQKTLIGSMINQPMTLTHHLEMGITELNVKDLTLMTNFYSQLVGLEVLSTNENSTTLGFQDRAVIRLVSTPENGPAAFGSAGLYHNAIVFTSRAVLAQTLERILVEAPEQFSGSSDHKVSEAFYFVDPEGNGLELYYDKDSNGWQWQNGRIVMGSSYIDPQAYIDTYGQVSDDPSKKMGHVHLKVGNIEAAKKFYVDALGLVITAETPGALFVSDGTYHHHIGLNTWESAGAGNRAASLGLKSLELRVAETRDLQNLEKRLQAKEISFQKNDENLSLSDPWGNVVTLSVHSN